MHSNQLLTMRRLVVVVALIVTERLYPVSSFQGARVIASSLTNNRYASAAPIIRSNSQLFESSPSSSSAASEWMEKEKQLEEEIDQAVDAAVQQQTPFNNDNEETTKEETPVTTPHSSSDRWEELHGNYILRPPNDQQPRALLHFLGGALLGAAPQLSYRYMLERLSSRGYLIVATPYQLSFDHLATCDEIIGRFETVAPSLAKREF